MKQQVTFLVRNKEKEEMYVCLVHPSSSPPPRPAHLPPRPVHAPHPPRSPPHRPPPPSVSFRTQSSGKGPTRSRQFLTLSVNAMKIIPPDMPAEQAELDNTSRRFSSQVNLDCVKMTVKASNGNSDCP